MSVPAARPMYLKNHFRAYQPLFETRNGLPLANGDSSEWSGLPSGLRIPKIRSSRWNPFGPKSLDLNPSTVLDDPVMLTLPELLWMTGIEGLDATARTRLTSFVTSREPEAGVDLGWGNLNPDAAFCLYLLAAGRHRTFAQDPRRKMRVLCTGTGVGLTEHMLLHCLEQTELTTCDILSFDGKQITPLLPLSLKQRSYQPTFPRFVGSELVEYLAGNPRCTFLHEDSLSVVRQQVEPFDLIVLDCNLNPLHLKLLLEEIEGRSLLAEDGVLFVDNVGWPSNPGPAVMLYNHFQSKGNLLFVPHERPGQESSPIGRFMPAVGFVINSPACRLGNNLEL